MKKVIYILLFLLLLIIYGIVEYYSYSNVYTGNFCVTKQKIEEQAEKYEKLRIDENGNLSRSYDELRKAFFDDIVQNGKYRMYIADINRKVYVNNEETLEGQGFPGNIMEVSTKNTENGQRLYMIVEDNESGKEVFRIKRYQIYPYKELLNMSYTGSASVVVQFRCELERGSKKQFPPKKN